MSTFEERTAYRARIAPGAAVGVTEDMIHTVVRAFYARARLDPQLGPIFDAAIGDGWEAHFTKLCDFWSSVLLMTGRFKGAPMPAHARLPGIDTAHFERWLALWRETVGAVCPPDAADLFVVKAELIAQSLQLGIAVSRGQMPPLPARR